MFRWLGVLMLMAIPVASAAQEDRLIDCGPRAFYDRPCGEEEFHEEPAAPASAPTLPPTPLFTVATMAPGSDALDAAFFNNPSPALYEAWKARAIARVARIRQVQAMMDAERKRGQR